MNRDAGIDTSGPHAQPLLPKTRDGSRSGQSHAAYPGVIKAIPRRQRVSSDQEQRDTTFDCKMPSENPSWPAVLWRIAVWLSGILGYFFSKAYGRLVGRSSQSDNARRLRWILTKMGPTAIKAGQQLSVRADMLPDEFCRELGKLLDRMAPFPFEQALALVEHALQRPLDTVFRTFDPVPIGSASIACVYQAELLSGEKVAVKVKRPHVTAHIHADLKAISLLCRVSEAFGIIKPGLTRHLRRELYRMITEELNFVLEARYTEIFRRTAKKNPYVSAPRIYHPLCNNEVIVSEFVSGVFLSEIIDALNSNNQEAIAQFQTRGFNFKKIGKRMMRILHWECYESLFFHADPHPANLIVRPDNTLIMIDFGSCGAVSDTMKRKLMTFHRQMLKNDVYGMSQTLISLLEPLPHCDTHSFTHDLIHIFRRLLLANESKHAGWQEKCTGWMWMNIIGLTRKYNIPINLDTLRIFRATFVYDTLIYRLHPQIDPRKEFAKWAKAYHERSRKKVCRSLWDRRFGPLHQDYQAMVEMSDLGFRLVQRVEKFLDTPKYSFAYGVGKVSYVVSTVTRTLLSALELLLLFIVVKGTHLYYIREAFSVEQFNLEYVLPLIFGDVHFIYFCSLLALMLFIRIRNILARLDEVDVN
jgi:predicted unusual protein kinase regulating ubiquinone biosynthesis (AarF/ABC1/UbiB family)